MPRKRDVLWGGVICRAAMLVVCLCAAVRSQESRPRIAFEHDGKGVTGFVLYAQPEKGKEIRMDLGLLPANRRGERSAELPVLPEGKYTLSIAAYNPTGESPRVQTSPHRIAVSKTNAGMTAEDARPVAATPSPATDDSVSKKASKPGTLGRLWRVVVGED